MPSRLRTAIDQQSSTDAGRLKGILASSVLGGPTAAASAAGPHMSDPIGVGRGGSVAAVVTSGPRGTGGFWLLLLVATCVPLVVRRAARRERDQDGAAADDGPPA